MAGRAVAMADAGMSDAPVLLPTSARVKGSLAAWSLSGWSRSIDRLRTRRVDFAWLAAFRVLFGLTMAVSATRFLAYGWVERLFLEQRYRFSFFGFAWLSELPLADVHGVFTAVLVLSLAVAAGAFVRVAAPLLALGLTYFQLLDVSNYLNHYYLAALLAWLLCVLPIGRAYSVDAWLRSRRGQLESPDVSVLALYLLRFQVGVVYFFAGMAKAQPDWLIHAQPLRIWLSARTDLPVLGGLLGLEGTALALSWAGFLFDTTVPFFLSLRRTRPFAFAAVLLFHTGTKLLFPIGMFPFIMVLSALVFFEPDWPRRVLGWFGRRLGGRAPLAAAGPAQAKGTRVPHWALALALSYAIIQVGLPLRYLAYPGNVLWHEQGMRFSWRVMVRAKGGSTTFRVVTEPGRPPVVVSPRNYLTSYQESEMSGQPDLILQLAHHIRDDFRRRGFPRVQVYADSRAALNGRRSQPFIDPGVDLARIEDGLSPASFVLPAPSAPPPHTRPTF